LRVISGTAGGLKIKTLKGLQTRPTADRIKESLFNIINPVLDKAVVLDLFAGTGALGIEALSRGAAFATFVDSSRESIAIIKDNLKHTNLEEYSEVWRAIEGHGNPSRD
jgi:16S rRNA (guanine(966)-N(2))-methyltransferase RsmD